MTEERKDLTGALRALESNNQVLPQDEQSKRNNFLQEKIQEKESSLIKPLRTLEGDTAELIKNTNSSLYTISKIEKEKNTEKESDPEKTETNRNAILLLLGALLIIAGASLILFFVLMRMNTQKEQPAPVVIEKNIINSDMSTSIEYDPTQKSLSDVIKSILSEEVKGQNIVENIKITEENKKISLSILLTGLSSNVPGMLLRALNEDDYMFGIVNNGERLPFIIAKINYYENSFGGMLQWENQNLANIFAREDEMQSTNHVWNDAFIMNKDIRIARDQDGKTLALYSFFDRQTLVITDNEITYPVIINALLNSFISR